MKHIHTRIIELFLVALAFCAAMQACAPVEQGIEVAASAALDAHRPVYAATFDVYTWLDGELAGQHSVVSDAVVAALRADVDRFMAECPDDPALCQMQAYEETMSRWRSDSGYNDRTRTLESLRQTLAAWGSAIEQRRPLDATARARDALTLVRQLVADRDVPPNVAVSVAGLELFVARGGA